MAEGPIKHKNIRWNPLTLEWFCLICRRTSNHADETGAHIELEKYECSVPWVDMPRDSPGHAGDG